MFFEAFFFLVYYFLEVFTTALFSLTLIVFSSYSYESTITFLLLFSLCVSSISFLESWNIGLELMFYKYGILLFPGSLDFLDPLLLLQTFTIDCLLLTPGDCASLLSNLKINQPKKFLNHRYHLRTSKKSLRVTERDGIKAERECISNNLINNDQFQLTFSFSLYKIRLFPLVFGGTLLFQCLRLT